MSLDYGKLAFIALTKAFSSSEPITKSLKLNNVSDIPVSKTDDRWVNNLWYIVWKAPSQWRYTGPNIIGLVFLSFRFSFDSWNTFVVTNQAPRLKVLSTPIIEVLQALEKFAFGSQYSLITFGSQYSLITFGSQYRIWHLVVSIEYYIW